MNDEEPVDEKPTGSAYFRHRSPTFSKEEVKVLLSIVEKYKTIVFNKSTSAAANYAKETAWMKIAKVFNSQGFTHVRSADCLKIKWDNLKKEARKLSKNLMDVKYIDNDDVTNQMVAMMCEAENNTSNIEELAESEGELNEPTDSKAASNDVHWNSNGKKEYEESIDGDDNERLINRSLNFTPNECNLLLQCVRREKSIVLSKTNTASANKVKSKAWSRITNSYNKLSPQKRSTKVLRTKFTNMKRLAKNVSFKDYFKDFTKKHQALEHTNESNKKIKSEPVFESLHNQEVDDVDDADDAHDFDSESNNHVNSTTDPLCTVLNSEFNLGLSNQFENKEIIKLKTDLLNYKMETAKLQRKRLEDLIQADSVDREAKVLETSLRLRAARLEAIAEEMKLPPTHPGLAYTVQESRAQNYIHQYHNT